MNAGPNGKVTVSGSEGADTGGVEVGAVDEDADGVEAGTGGCATVSCDEVG